MELKQVLGKLQTLYNTLSLSFNELSLASTAFLNFLSLSFIFSSKYPLVYPKYDLIGIYPTANTSKHFL